jgi:hypothetical protein
MIGEKIRQQPWPPLQRRPPPLWPWRRRRPLVCSTARSRGRSCLVVFFFKHLQPLRCLVWSVFSSAVDSADLCYQVLRLLSTILAFFFFFVLLVRFLFFWYVVFVLLVCVASVWSEDCGVIPMSHVCTDKLDALYIAIEMIFSLSFFLTIENIMIWPLIMFRKACGCLSLKNGCLSVFYRRYWLIWGA